MSVISIVQIARLVSVVSFASYGIGCFSSRQMRLEFERYKVPQLRQLTGGLQIAGALGIVAGYWFRPLLALSAGGLMLMMIYAVITRFKIRDPLYAALPAFSLALLNAYIVFTAFSN
ncbi:MAG: DoxX family protein [Acidobacteriota bacterium]|nr:DoxX family protein [Acidobacteriota bacterium]